MTTEEKTSIPEEKVISAQPEAPVKKAAPKKKKSKGWQSLLLAVIPVFLLAASLFLVRTAMSKALSSAWDSYKDSEKATAETVHDTVFDYFKEKAEAKHHVSNRASITLGSIKQEAKLEVFRVPDTEFIIENKDDNKYGITSWIKVKGTGIFTVNLNLSDFIVDSERQIVTVRIPRLELEYDMGDGQANFEKLLYQQDLHLPTFTNETKAATEIQLRMIEEGRRLIREEIKTKPVYYFSAQEAAQDALTSLIRSLNPDQDVKVIVEFVEN